MLGLSRAVAIHDMVEAEQRRIDAYRDGADPQVAERLGRWYMDYGEHVSAPVIAALGMASDDEQLMSFVATIAAMQKAEAPDQEGVTVREQRHEEWWRKALGIGWDAAGWVVGKGMVLPKEAMEALNIPELTKGASRTFITGMMAPLEALQTTLSQRWQEAAGGIGALRRGDVLGAAGSWLDLNVSTPGELWDAARSTTAAQAIGPLLAGEQVDMGTGFFPGGKVFERQAQAARDIRGTLVDPWGNEVAWTYGRGMASAFGLADNEKAWSVTSGLVDAAVSIFLDPVNYIHPGKTLANLTRRGAEVAASAVKEGDDLIAAARFAAKEADELEAAGDYVRAMVRRAQAADLAVAGMRRSGLAQAAGKVDPAWRDTVDRAAGLLPLQTTHRPAVVSQQTLGWLYSGDGRRLIEDWIPKHHWTQLWKETDGRVPASVAYRLSRAATVEDRIRVIGEAIEHGEVLFLPTGGPLRGRAPSVGLRIASGLERRYKQFTRRVTSTTVWTSPDDFEESAENLWRLTAHLKIPEADRVRIMDRFAQAILDSAPSTRAGNVFKAIEDIENVFAGYLVRKGVDPEVADLVTRFTDTPEMRSIFDFDDTGRARSLAFVQSANGEPVYGPLFITQALKEGVSLIDPAELDKIAEELSGFRRVLGPTGLGAAKAAKAGIDEERFFSEIGKPRALRRLPVDVLRFYQDRIWKPLAIARAAYLTKVSADDLARAMTYGHIRGPWQLVMLVLGREAAKDAMGHSLLVRGFAQELAESPDEAYRLMSTALAMFDSNKARMDLFDYAAASFRRGTHTVVDLKTSPKSWRTAMRSLYVARSSDPIARMIAAGGPVRANVRVIAGKAVADMTPAELKALDGVDGIVTWLMNEGTVLRRRYQAMMQAIAPGADFDDPAVVRAWVEQQAMQIAELTGGRPEMREMLARKGTHVWVDLGNGKKARRKVPIDYKFGTDAAIDVALAQKGWTGSKKQYLLSRMLDDWVRDGGVPERVPMEAPMRARVRGASPAGQIGELFDRATRQLFTTAYGAVSDRIARSPTLRALYWKQMPDLMANMDPKQAKLLVERAIEAKVDADTLAKMRKAAAAASGEATIDDVHRTAAAFATEKTRRLFYDAANARNWTGAIKLIAPFANAWWEVLSTWGRIIRNNPDIWYHGSKVVRGLKGATLDDPDDERTRGVIWTDPVTGQDMFTFPLSNALVKAFMKHPIPGGAVGGAVAGGLAGWIFSGNPVPGAIAGAGIGALAGTQLEGMPAPDMELAAPVASLSIGASFLPGMGPVGTIAVDEILPDVPEFDDIRKILMPYGPPGSPEDTLVPAWLDKLGAVYLPWSESARTYMSELTTSMRVLAASGEYGYTYDEQERLVNDARMTARAVTILRGLAGFIGPSAPRSVYKVEVDEGNVLFTELVRVYGQLQQEDPRNASKRFIEMFGVLPAYVMASKTATTVGGLGATEEFGIWEAENAELLERYPEVAGFFGPHGTVGEFSFDTYRRQIARGARKARSPQELAEEAQAIIGRWLIDRVRSQLPADEREWTEEHRMLLRLAREEAMRLLPLYDPKRSGAEAVATRDARIQQVITAASDPLLEDNEAAIAVRRYAEWRAVASQISETLGFSPTSWRRNKRMAGIRHYLRMVGEHLVEEHPDFKRVWQELFLREMEDDGQEVLLGAAAS